jgi:hypothetical protein
MIHCYCFVLLRNNQSSFKVIKMSSIHIFTRFFSETGSHYVSLTGLKLMFLLLQPLECWDFRCVPPHLAELYIIIFLMMQNRSIFLIFLLLHWVEVHCDIYKSSYNVSNMSYLNSSLHRSLLCSFPHSWNCFNRSQFYIYIHVYTVFAPYSPSYTFPCPRPPPPVTNPLTPWAGLFDPLVLQFCGEKEKNDIFVCTR